MRSSKSVIAIVSVITVSMAVYLFGYYHGQYQFLGRLQKPMTVLGVDQPPTDFVDAHPDAIIVAYYYIDEPQPIPDDITPLETFRFRDFKVMFWQGRDLQLHPELGNRS